MERAGNESQAAPDNSSTLSNGWTGKRENGRLSLIKKTESPIGNWFEEYSRRNGESFRRLARKISLSNIGVRGNFGLTSLSAILQNAPEALKLSPDETSDLAEAVAQTIEQRIASGHDYSVNSGVNVRRVQAGLDCETFNGEQAGEILGTNRKHIFFLRRILGFPVLMTREHIDQLKLQLESTRVTRERRRKTLAEQREKSIH